MPAAPWRSWGCRVRDATSLSRLSQDLPTSVLGDEGGGGSPAVKGRQIGAERSGKAGKVRALVPAWCQGFTPKPEVTVVSSTMDRR